MPFVKWRKFQAGAGKGRAGFVGLLSSITAFFDVADGTSVAMHTHVIPANTLYKNGMALRVKAWGSFAADADAGTVFIRFSGLTGTAIAQVAKTNAGLWNVEAVIFRTGASSQKSMGEGHCMNTAQETVTNAAPAVPMNAASSIVIEGDGTNAADIRCEGSFVEVLSN